MAKGAKFCVWVLRIFQHITALIVIGVSAYMVDQFRKYSTGIPQECFLPLLFVRLPLSHPSTIRDSAINALYSRAV